MLAEFAFTPSIFDETAHDDKDLWLDQLRELGGSMFPRLAASPVMVSNLFAGSWHPVATQICATIKDHRARALCLDLLKKIENALVFRPACNDWPEEDECRWAREAIQSARDEEIDRIVATRTVRELLATECSFIRSIDEVRDSGFWHEISENPPVPMQISSQAERLRKLCLHTEFLCLLTPYISGGIDDETDFTIELIRSALRRPTGYRKASVEVHTLGPSGDPEGLSRCRRNISGRLREALRPGESVSLYLWPSTAGLLDRYLVGGAFVESPDGDRQKSPRWGVAMQHIARPGDERKSLPPTTWNLLNRAALSDCFDRYFRENVTGMLPGFPVLIESH